MILFLFRWLIWPCQIRKWCSSYLRASILRLARSRRQHRTCRFALWGVTFWRPAFFLLLLDRDLKVCHRRPGRCVISIASVMKGVFSDHLGGSGVYSLGAQPRGCYVNQSGGFRHHIGAIWVSGMTSWVYISEHISFFEDLHTNYLHFQGQLSPPNNAEFYSAYLWNPVLMLKNIKNSFFPILLAFCGWL